MSILNNLKNEVTANKAKSKKVSFNRTPFNVPLPAVISNVYELEEEKIVVEFSIITSSTTIIKRTRCFTGGFGEQLLSQLIDTAGVEDVNDLIGNYALIKLQQNQKFINVDVLQFIDEDEFDAEVENM